MKPFTITCCVGGEDESMFMAAVNQGIDSHLEAFTESKFHHVEGDFVARLHMDFDRSELPLLVRRLRELEGFAEAMQWADDIEEALNAKP